MPDGFERAAGLLPAVLRKAAGSMQPGQRVRAEEFRLRMGQAASVRLPEGELRIGGNPVDQETVAEVLEKATRASLHAVTEELRRGFLFAPGGIRVGVCGTAVSDGSVRTLREISSLCIRIPRQIIGAGSAVIPKLLGCGSVLILSPPCGGKTTFLRELVRTVSDRGTQVGLADERGELAGMYGGVPQFDVGRCTDVLTAAPKAEAAVMLLRAMGPEVVAMDEIATPEDAAAVERLLGCGVRVFATAHATGPEDLRKRSPEFRRLLEHGAFQAAVRISGRAERKYEVISL